MDLESKQSGIQSNTSKDNKNSNNNALGNLTKRFVQLIQTSEDQVI